jgi:hypothetical protein
MLIDKMTVDEIYVDEITLDEMYIDKMALDEMYKDKMALNEMYIDKMALDEMYINGMIVDNCNTAKLTSYIQANMIKSLAIKFVSDDSINLIDIDRYIVNL